MSEHGGKPAKLEVTGMAQPLGSGNDVTNLLAGLMGLPRPNQSATGNVADQVVFRQRIYHSVPYGHFDEVVGLCMQLNDLIQSRGGTPGTLWTPTVGPQNELIVEFEFTDLGAFGQGRTSSNADPVETALVGKIGAAVVPNSVRTELWQTAPYLASGSGR